jgi:hypothetical protein
MRLHALGYRTDVVDSVTSGEAPDRLRDWIAQRALWHKGFLLTHSLHRLRYVSTPSQALSGAEGLPLLTPGQGSLGHDASNGLADHCRPFREQTCRMVTVRA